MDIIGRSSMLVVGVKELTNSYWSPTYFRKCNEVQLIRGCIAF